MKMSAKQVPLVFFMSMVFMATASAGETATVGATLDYAVLSGFLVGLVSLPSPGKTSYSSNEKSESSQTFMLFFG